MPVVKTSREEIIKVAIGVFRTKGYYNTSMNDLAQACDLQKGSFYHYFDSKEQLMLEGLQYVHMVLKSRVFIYADDPMLSAKEKLEKILLKLGKYLLEKSGGCIVGNTSLETAGQVTLFKSTLKAIFTDWITAMKTIFMEQYSESTAQRLAEQVIMEFEGAVMFSQIYDDQQYLKDVFVRTMAKLK